MKGTSCCTVAHFEFTNVTFSGNIYRNLRFDDSVKIYLRFSYHFTDLLYYIIHCYHWSRKINHTYGMCMYLNTSCFNEGQWAVLTLGFDVFTVVSSRNVMCIERCYNLSVYSVTLCFRVTLRKIYFVMFCTLVKICTTTIWLTGSYFKVCLLYLPFHYHSYYMFIWYYYQGIFYFKLKNLGY